MVDATDHDPSRREILMIGTPYTGKTTFLALFYLALVNAKRTRLRLASWFGDREHLNAIAEPLMRCKQAMRTPLGDERILDLPLETPAGEIVQLLAPDLSGEIWQEALRHRQWPAAIDERIQGTPMKLVFLHSDEVDAAPTINAVHQSAASLGATQALPSPGRSAPDPVDLPTEGHGGFQGRVPTQVDLVDLIQLTCEQRGPRPTRLCLIISAWDRATGTPGDFVSLNLPLLAQYLETNRSWLDCQIFGVSAQGGRFDVDEAREHLADEDAVERAVIKTATGESAEVGSIVEWALGLD